MLRVLIEAGDRAAGRLEGFLADHADVAFRRSTDREATREQLRTWRPHLPVLDPEWSETPDPFVAEAAAHALAIAFLPSGRREDAEALLAHCPVGVLPPTYDRGDVASLLAAVRSEAELPPPAPQSPSRPAIEMLALGSAAAAALIGFSLPGAPALLQGDRQSGYYVAALLSLVALAALLGVRRPWAAAVQAALVGLVTLAPTQA